MLFSCASRIYRLSILLPLVCCFTLILLHGLVAEFSSLAVFRAWAFFVNHICIKHPPTPAIVFGRSWFSSVSSFLILLLSRFTNLDFLAPCFYHQRIFFFFLGERPLTNNSLRTSFFLVFIMSRRLSLNFQHVFIVKHIINFSSVCIFPFLSNKISK